MVSARDNDNVAGGKCDKSRWQSGLKENKEGGRPTNDEDVDKEVDEKDNRSNKYFDYFDFQLLLGWVWVAREQILRRARWFLLCSMFSQSYRCILGIFLFAIKIDSNVFFCQFKFQVIAPGELLSLQSRKPSVYNQVHLGGHLSI